MTEHFIFARNKLSADGLVGMKEVAEITGKSYWYIRALHCESEKSKVPFPAAATKIGRRPLWKRSDIEEWMEKKWMNGQSIR